MRKRRPRKGPEQQQFHETLVEMFRNGVVGNDEL